MLNPEGEQSLGGLRGRQAPGLSLSLVVPSWNGLHLLRESLPTFLGSAERYRETCRAPVELIVVDDGSTDGTVEALAVEFPEVRPVRRTENGGFAAACNLGFREARHELVALLNNDVVIEPDYLLFKAPHFSDPGVFAVTAKVFEWDTPWFATGGRFGRFRRGFWSVYFNYDVEGDFTAWMEEHRLLSAYAIGGFATYHRPKLEALGGFDELLSPFHWEDVDLSYRAWKRGWSVHYEPRSRARHRTSATIEANWKKRTVERISLRNRLLFHWVNLHSPTYLAAHLGMLGLLLLSRILVLDYHFYWAIGSALRHLPEVLRRRRQERLSASRSDREVSRLLKDFYASAPVRIYRNQREVASLHPEAT
jgi:GT2 family glycosyltransferase